MNLGFLDKSSKVTPLLVRLYDSLRLNGLAENSEPLAKAELTAAVCELLEMELSERESELVADVLIGLLRQAELDLRQALAERLAVMENVPLRLIIQMAGDEISVAAPVLTHSTILSDLDLGYIIKSQTTEYWQAIARRKVINDQVVNMLTDTGDLETAIALAENKNIILNEYAITALSDMAQKSDRLAQPLLRREEVSADVARKLYRFVGETLRRFIEQEYGITEGSVTDALDEVLLEFVEATEEEHEFLPTVSMLKDAQRQKDKDLLNIKLMLGALRRGQIKPFVAQFAEYTGLPVNAVLEILVQPSGQGLAVACKAFEIVKEDFISIYLLTNRIRNHGHMVELGDMGKAINYYTKIDKEMARNIVKNSSIETLGE